MAKNRRYRQVDVKSVDVEKIAELGSKLLVGIDVAKTNQVATFEDPETHRRLTVKWAHPAQTRDFFALLEGLRARKRTVEIVMEPSGTYGDPFLHWFHTHDFPVRRVLGIQVHAGAAMLDGVRSGHDAKSAGLMVAIDQLEGSRDWLARAESTRDLRSLVTLYRWHDDQRRKLFGMAEAHLARWWPELSTLLSARSKIYWRLLAEYSGPEGVAADLSGAAHFMRRVGRAFLMDEKITAVCASAASTLGVPMNALERRELAFIGSEFLRCADECSTLGADIEGRVRILAAPELVRLLGAATTGTLIAHNLDPLRFDNPRAFVKALGLNLKVRSSGKHQGKLRLTKRGAPRARWMLVLAAARLIPREPVVKAWHQAKRARDGAQGGARNGMISVVAIARKLAAAAWHVARGAEFDAERLFDASRLGRYLHAPVMSRTNGAIAGAPASDELGADEALADEALADELLADEVLADAVLAALEDGGEEAMSESLSEALEDGGEEAIAETLSEALEGGGEKAIAETLSEALEGGGEKAIAETLSEALEGGEEAIDEAMASVDVTVHDAIAPPPSPAPASSGVQRAPEPRRRARRGDPRPVLQAAICAAGAEVVLAEEAALAAEDHPAVPPQTPTTERHPPSAHRPVPRRGTAAPASRGCPHQARAVLDGAGAQAGGAGTADPPAKPKDALADPPPPAPMHLLSLAGRLTRGISRLMPR